jgi:hypothetical protein
MHHFVTAQVPPSIVTEMLDMICCPVVNVHRSIIAPIVLPKLPQRVGASICRSVVGKSPAQSPADRPLNRVQIRWPVVAFGALLGRSTREQALLVTSRSGQ